MRKMEKLVIILCTYNGERFLKEQLESYTNQTFNNWSLFVFDDQSTDRTREMIHDFSKTVENKVVFKKNENKLGFSQNFLNGLKNTKGFDYYVLSDQDDIWLDSKLEKAISVLKNIKGPALYCGRTKLIDEEGFEIGFSPLFRKAPSFKNSLVQSIAGGNTMVFNKEAYELIERFYQFELVSHDWSIYQIITGVGGFVYYDKDHHILYRQHRNNIIGSNIGLKAKIGRIKRMIKGDFKKWNDINTSNLLKNNILLSTENRKTLWLFEKSRKNIFLLNRLYFLMKSGVYRQTFSGNIALYIASIIRKI